MKKIKYLILPFLAILGVVSVKAYDFIGIDKVSRVDFGLYQDTTLLTSALTSCISSNDGYCGLEDSDLPNTTNTYNNMRIVIRGNLNQSFQTGTQYMISYYFYQYTPGYFVRQGDITQVTGNTYRDFTNWTTDNITIISYNLNLVETSSNKGLYRFDVVFIPSSTSIAGFNFRIYQDYESISNNNDCYIEGTRYVSISQLSPGQIDYTQNFNNVINNQNQNTQDIIDNQNQNTQLMIDEIKKGQLTCGYNYSETFDYSKSNTLGYLNNNNLYSNNNFRVSDYTLIFGGNIYSIEWGNYGSSTTEYLISLYDSNKNYLSQFNYRLSSSLDLSSYSGLLYIRVNLNFHSNNNLVIVSNSSICVPTSYLQMKQNNDINNNLSDINDSLTDDTPPDTNGLSNASGWLPPGPVDSILNLPLTLLQSLNNAFSSNSCQPISIDLPHISNRPLVIPCMSTVWQGFGLLTFFTWIGRVLGGVLLYKYLIGLYKWVDDTLTMRENNNFDDGSLG